MYLYIWATTGMAVPGMVQLNDSPPISHPAPGVVLGGASGHFIGHVACNYDIEMAQGISRISPGIFAIGGISGIIHLAEWSNENKRLLLRRRIGSVVDPGCLELDAQGRILCGHNIWNWNCDALSPATISHVFKITAPCSHFDADTIIGIGEHYGKPAIIMGTFSEEELYCSRRENLEMPEKIAGTALYRETQGKGAWQLLVLGAHGDAKLQKQRVNPRSMLLLMENLSLYTIQSLRRIAKYLFVE